MAQNNTTTTAQILPTLTLQEQKKVASMKRELALLQNIMNAVDIKIKNNRAYRLSDEERKKANKILYLEDSIRRIEQRAMEEAVKKRNAAEEYQHYLQQQEDTTDVEDDIDEDKYW